MPLAGLSADDAINGYYGPSVQPAAVHAASGSAAAGSGNAMSLPTVPHASAVLVWWFILLAICIAMHVLTLKVER